MNGMQHVGFKNNKDQLKQYFKAFDLAINKSKKDQCDISLLCTGYEVSNIQYNTYQIHNNDEERGSTFQKII